MFKIFENPSGNSVGNPVESLSGIPGIPWESHEFCFSETQITISTLDYVMLHKICLLQPPTVTPDEFKRLKV